MAKRFYASRLVLIVFAFGCGGNQPASPSKPSRIFVPTSPSPSNAPNSEQTAPQIGPKPTTEPIPEPLTEEPSTLSTDSNQDSPSDGTTNPADTESAKSGPAVNYGGGVGATCDDSSDCRGNASACLTGHPNGGMCTSPCGRYCGDTEASKTFCVMNDSKSGGICVPKCTAGACRDGYVCVERERANRPETKAYVCEPRAKILNPSCRSELEPFVNYALDFNPNTYAANNSSGVTCQVWEPVRYSRFMRGVFYQLEDHGATGLPPWDDLYSSCEMAQALLRASDVLRSFKVVGATFRIAYACDSMFTHNEFARQITGHARGEAIDLVALTIRDSAGERTKSIGDPSLAELVADIAAELQARRLFNTTYTPVCVDATNPDLFRDILHLEVSLFAEWRVNPGPTCEQ